MPRFSIRTLMFLVAVLAIDCVFALEMASETP